MNALFLSLLNRSVAASVLILAVALLRRVLHRAPRWLLCALWGLVALRLICPVGLPAPTSVFRLLPAAVRESGEVAVFSYAGGSEKPLLQVDTVQLEPPSDGADTLLMLPGGALAVTQRSHDAYLPPLTQAWLLGVVLMLLYAAVSTLLLRRRLAAAAPCGEGLWVCDGLPGPFVLGLLRPRIYLPSSLRVPELGYVVAHERAHLSRGDHWWKPLGFLLLSVYWFNPFCWLAYVLFGRDVELACDEKALRGLGREDRLAYSEALLRCSAPRGVWACPAAFGEIGVKDRVRAVLRYRKAGWRTLTATGLACLVLIACFMTSPIAGRAQAEPDPAEDAAFLDAAEEISEVGSLYQPLSYDDFAARYGLTLVALPSLPERFVRSDSVYVWELDISVEGQGRQRVLQLWYDAAAQEYVCAKQWIDPDRNDESRSGYGKLDRGSAVGAFPWEKVPWLVFRFDSSRRLGEQTAVELSWCGPEDIGEAACQAMFEGAELLPAAGEGTAPVDPGRTVKTHYVIAEDSPAGSPPREENYGVLPPERANEMLDIVRRAEASGLLEGQSLCFDPTADFVPGSTIQYYYDETILSICWKELIDGSTCSFNETKIADASQLRRKLAGDSFGSEALNYATAFAGSVNAVAAVNADLYLARDVGILVYGRELYRFNTAGYNDSYSLYNCVDTLFVTAEGEFLFGRRGDLWDEESLRSFIRDKDILFSVAFGPILVSDSAVQVCDGYPMGEVNEGYSRAGIGQVDKLHYLYMSLNHAPEMAARWTVNTFAQHFGEKGVQNAYCLDGGQTGELVFRGEPFNHIDFGAERLVSDIVYFASALPETA